MWGDVFLLSLIFQPLFTIWIFGTQYHGWTINHKYLKIVYMMMPIRVQHRPLPLGMCRRVEIVRQRDQTY